MPLEIDLRRYYDQEATDRSTRPGPPTVTRVPVAQASVLALPFAHAGFDAGWTMSTLIHTPDQHVDTAKQELLRVPQ